MIIDDKLTLNLRQMLFVQRLISACLFYWCCSNTLVNITDITAARSWRTLQQLLPLDEAEPAVLNFYSP